MEVSCAHAGSRKAGCLSLDALESHPGIRLVKQAVEQWRTPTGIGEAPRKGALSRKIKDASSGWRTLGAHRKFWESSPREGETGGALALRLPAVPGRQSAALPGRARTQQVSDTRREPPHPETRCWRFKTWLLRASVTQGFLS